jgi:hypothetical protein
MRFAMKVLQTGAIACAILFAAGTAAQAGDAPKIGGGASINVSIGKGGVANAGNVAGGSANIKQGIGSVISGNISGTLKSNVSIGEAGVVNAGNVEGGKANICQSIGTVGSDCDG